MFSERILVDNNKNTPKATMMMPPIMLRLSMYSPAASDSMLLIKTPNVENTTENPSTKNMVFEIMLILLMERTVAFLELNSASVVPEM